MLRSDMVIEAALLIRSTGSVVAAWSRAPLPEEVLAVMSATMLASISMIVENLGAPAPRTVAVAAGGHQIFAVQANSEQVLILIAPEAVRAAYLRELSQRILSHLSTAVGPRRVKDAPRVRKGV